MRTRVYTCVSVYTAQRLFYLILVSVWVSNDDRLQLAEKNEEVATLEKFIRASTRLQNEATAAFNQANQNILAASMVLRKRYGTMHFLVCV